METNTNIRKKDYFPFSKGKNNNRLKNAVNSKERHFLLAAFKLSAIIQTSNRSIVSNLYSMNVSRYTVLILTVLLPFCTFAQNRKVQNLPYADLKRIHLGFSVGTHIQDLTFTHSGNMNENGEVWFMEVPEFSPGFSVNLTGDLYLCDHLNLRFTPGMYFGNKTVKMREETSGEYVIQDIKSNYVVLPVDIKFSSKRYNNYRPYLTGGIMGTFDVSKKRSEYLKLNTFDFYLSIGFGCDLYLPFFKLIPELKFCFGLTDVINHKRKDLTDPLNIKYTDALKKAASNMVVLTFYFE